VAAEGSFYEQNNKEFYFNVSQTKNKALMLAIQMLFDPSRNMYYNTTTQGSIVRMSSVKDIQKVINFFSFANHHPLVGYKKDQYLT
jgi:hypothetical protein